MHGLAAMIGPTALATKEFAVTNQGSAQIPFVRIVGRPAGFIDFIFTLVGIDTTTVFEVYSDRIVYQKSSLSGSMKTLYPMTAIAGTTAGYFKPTIYLLLALVTIWTVILPVIFVALYFVNKSLLVGVEVTSGSFSAIAFKRSVIEGRKVEREDADAVIKIINELVLASKQSV
jgi:hypothetical protein